MTFLLRRIGVILLLSGLFARPALAQAGIQALQNSASVHFPVDIDFHLQALSTWPITQVSLEYGIIGRACNDSRAQQSISFTSASSIDVSWTLKFSSIGTLPPGAQFWWQWVILDASGAQLITPKETRTIADDAFVWHNLTRQLVTLTWSQGGQAFGSQLLDQAIVSLDRLNRHLGVRPPGPVQLVIYPTAADVRAALVNVPEWTGGVAYPEYDLTVIGIAPGESAWAATVIPHELAHLVVGALVFNCLGISLPTWLNEGLSVVAQGPAAPQDLGKLSVALQAGALPSLRSLAGGFQADSAQAGLSYTRSGQVVRYLVDTFGADHLSTLLATMQSGSPIDAALGKVYGLDTDGLDAAWRLAAGVPATAAVATQASGATQPANTAVPTLALWTAVSPATATAAPTVTPAATSSPRAIAAVLTSTPQPALPTNPPPSPTGAPTRDGRLTPLGSPWLVGGAALLLCGLVLGVIAIGFRLTQGKT